MSSTSINNSSNNSRKRRNSNTTAHGVDTLINDRAKALNLSRPGDKMSFRLIKGRGVTRSHDPVDARAPPTAFPILAKFPESVVRPAFDAVPWNSARLYQQDIPKPVEDDSEEEEAAVARGEANKKRWKFNRRRNEPAVGRQWILQEQVDFLETMVARREKRSMGKDVDGFSKTSTRYEGVPEFNTSHYVLLTVRRSRTQPSQQSADGDDGGSELPQIHVDMLPQLNPTILFAQPAARRALSLSQAEQAIQDQRAGIRTNLLMRSDQNGTTSANPPPPSAAAAAAVTQRLPLSLQKSKHANSSKFRLLEKLKKKSSTAANGEDEEDGDDIMADVAFRNRKGRAGAGAARQELLQSLGDGVNVSEDGVLGGTDDAVFGGRQRFGQLNLGGNKNVKDKDGLGGDDGGDAGGDDGMAAAGAGGDADGKADRGNDGLAMADDFYQRDVQAEYEELDFDAAEQFDDDDVDLGESEVMVENSGFGGDADEDDDVDEQEQDEEAISGAEGLATVAGFKAMLAKARGEATALPLADGVEGGAAANGGGVDGPGKDLHAAGGRAGAALSPSATSDAQKKRKRDMLLAENDHFAKVVAAAEKTAQAVREKAVGATGGDAAAAGSPSVAAANAAGTAAAAAKPPAETAVAAAAAASAIQLDENGLRVISLESVRREIWLNHGSIPMKRLMRMFDVKKKSSEDRQNVFREVVKELCTIKSDPVSGRMLVLKQHYSNMG